MKKQNVTVAFAIEQLLAVSDKQQKEIAAEVGYDKPNMITMIKQGKTKLPFSKIGAFAKALHTDPAYLLRIAMGEYMPETWDEIEKILGAQLISQNELHLVKAVRSETRGLDVDFSNPEVKKAVKAALEPFCKKANDQAKRDIDLERNRVGKNISLHH